MSSEYMQALAPGQKEQLLSVMPNGQLDIVSMGRVLAQSGYFKDIKSLSQGIVKIMLGQELGLGPLMSIMKLYIVKENPVISANLMATRIRQSGIYDYEIVHLDNMRATIRFFRKKGNDWKTLVPDITFTVEDAKRAHLGGLNGQAFHAESNWAKWPRNMLFARCMSDGYRFHCPDVFSMGVMTPGDFDVAVDAAGEIMRDVTPEPEAKPETKKGTSAIDRIVNEQKSAAPQQPKEGGAEGGDTAGERAAPAADPEAVCSTEQFDQLQILQTEHDVEPKVFINFVKSKLGYKMVAQLKRRDYERAVRFLQNGGQE